MGKSITRGTVWSLVLAAIVMPTAVSADAAVPVSAAQANRGVIDAAGRLGMASFAEEITRDVPAPTPPTRDRDGNGARFGVPDPTGRVTVEVLHSSGTGGAIRGEVGRLGGEVLGSSPGVTLMRVAPEAVDAFERRPDVAFVRSPLRVDLLPDQQPSSASLLGAGDAHVVTTNAAAWQAVGYRGKGIKVGIVDYFDGGAWSTAQSYGAVPAPSATFCRVAGGSCNLWSAGSRHGVAVAEIIHDMAPDATLYLATAVTVTDLAAAVAWFDSQGVQIISRSLGSELDGPGDGTGSVDAVVDDAVSRGMVWFNAAGNAASASGVSDGGYWRGSFVDADANGWLEFAPGDEQLGFLCGQIQGFRWSDWQAVGRTDYDIYITNSSSEVLAASEDDQTLGAPPIELPGLIDCNANPVVFLWVYRWDAGSGTGGDILEFMVNMTAFEYSSNPYSVSGPAGDSANAGMVAVGAVDPAVGAEIATYSSQGPTNDGRIKPDLSAPSCLPNVTYAPYCFNGTSAATPVAAGAAALIWGAGVATTPQTVAEYLRSRVVDRGADGPDNVYGAGQLYLGDPTPPPANVAPIVSAGSNQMVTLPSSAALNGTVTDDGLPAGSLTSMWVKVSGPGTVKFGSAQAVDTTAGFSTDGVYVLRLSATDGALSNSDDVVITVNPPPPDVFVDDDDSVFEPDIDWMATVGITQGCNPPINDLFCPTRTVTRGQMAAFLHRALPDLPVVRTAIDFTDDDDALFEADIEWLYSVGVTQGNSATTFNPNGAVTRGQMAAFLVRALQYTDDGGGDLFIDDDASQFRADIDRLGTAGVTRGCNPPTNDKFCPNAPVTRGAMAAFLHRALGG